MSISSKIYFYFLICSFLKCTSKRKEHSDIVKSCHLSPHKSEPCLELSNLVRQPGFARDKNCVNKTKSLFVVI